MKDKKEKKNKKNKKPNRRIGRFIHRLDKMLYRNLSCSAKQAGMDELTIVHGWILRYLYENQEREIYQKDIEKEFGIGRSSVTSTIQIMERNGYLQREAAKQDARLKRVLLTQKGIAAQEGIENLINGLSKKTLHGVTEEELDIFFAVMGKIENNLLKQQKEREEKKEEPKG